MIDIARLMTMLFVIMGHANIRSPFQPGYSSLLSIMVAFTAMAGVPFFFFMAGYFTKGGGAILNWRRAGQILLAMVFWCLLGHFWFGAINQLESGNQVDIGALCNPSICGVLGEWSTVNTPGSWDCWFLKALIPLVLISPCLYRLSSPLLACATCVAGVWASANVSVDWLPFFLSDKALEGFTFFAMGVLFRRWLTIQLLGDFVGKIYWFVIAATIMMCAVQCLWPHVFEQGEFYTDFWGILYVLSLSKLVCKVAPRFASWLASFGPGVFFIYMVQEMLVMQSRWFFTLHPINKHAYALVPFVIFAVLMMGFALLRRYMSWAGGLLWLASGKR